MNICPEGEPASQGRVAHYFYYFYLLSNVRPSTLIDPDTGDSQQVMKLLYTNGRNSWKIEFVLVRGLLLCVHLVLLGQLR